MDGKWWLVTPEGHLFFSVGVNVARTMTDATYGPTHRDWYTSDVNRNGSMSYTLWNLQKKFGTSSYESPYYDFLIDRMNSWGLNTIGNWSAGALYSKGRKPYVCTIYSRNSSVPALSNYGWYLRPQSSVLHLAKRGKKMVWRNAVELPRGKMI